MKVDKQLMLKEIESALLDCDGSCRDINFSESISRDGAIGILNFLDSSWMLSQALDENGEDIPFADLSSTLERESGSLSTIWILGTNPSHIQAYFFWNTDSGIFCEITFFPQDFDNASFTLDGFLLLLSKLVSAAHSKEYYVRFENYSWSHKEPMKEWGLILSHETFQLPIA
jgi:hypothetical protein